MFTPFYILVSFAFGYFLYIHAGKRSKKQGQSLDKHVVSFLARSIERYYCDVGNVMHEFYLSEI